MQPTLYIYIYIYPSLYRYSALLRARTRSSLRRHACACRTDTDASRVTYSLTRVLRAKERVCVYTRTPRGDRCIARTHLHLDTRDPFESFLSLSISFSSSPRIVFSSYASTLTPPLFHDRSLHRSSREDPVCALGSSKAFFLRPSIIDEYYFVDKFSLCLPFSRIYVVINER